MDFFCEPFRHPPVGLSSMQRRSPAPLLAGLLWAAAVGAQQYDLRVFGVEEGLPGASVNAIREDSLGRLWLDTDGGLCAFDGRGFTRWEKHAFEPPKELGAVWDEREQRWSLLYSTGPIPHFSGGMVEEMITRSGERWTGTVTGVEVRSAQGERRITEANGLGSNDVRCMHQDRSGTVWIGTALGGLARYSSDAFIHFTERDGLNARMVTAIHRTPDSLLWFGTNSGYVAYWDGQRVVSTGVQGGSYPMVRALNDDGHGHLLVGTDLGLQQLEIRSGRFVQLLAGVAVNRILIAPDGRILLATSEGVKAGNAQGFAPLGTSRLRANDLLIIDDLLYMGTEQGVITASLNDEGRDQRTFWPEAGEITSLARDRTGGLWIGTRGQGLWRDIKGDLKRITIAQGLASNDIEQVLLDAFDNVWVGTRRGFDHLELDEEQLEIINITHYGREDGFICGEAFRNACLLDADSTLWFGTARGVTRFDPRKVLVDPEPPSTRITDLQLNYEHADWSAWCDSVGADGLPLGLVLPYDRNHLTFTFQGISLAYPEKVRYQFILEGQESDWSPITATDRVTYSNLPPGSYTFNVIARNASGIWNDAPSIFSFTIEPPLYRTNGFMAGSGVLLLASLWTFVRLRERRLRKDREHLERTVKERTRQLEDEKHRSDQLLLNILPETTAAELKERGSAEARSYPNCTVLFSDFQGFTSISEQMEAHGIVAELDRFFRAFDRITTTHGLEKIKTIGDAYMCAAGVPNASPTHALDAVKTAIEMVQAVDRINAERAVEGKEAWPIRIGMHSGPLVAGVVGEKKFAYDIWGGTVNLASRMESNGAAGRINISGTTYALVMHAVQCTPRGPIKVKGRGEVQMYFVKGMR